MVSSMLESAGLTHAIISVWLFPPSESGEEEEEEEGEEEEEEGHATVVVYMPG
jgi:hypothetical protein